MANLSSLLTNTQTGMAGDFFWVTKSTTYTALSRDAILADTSGGAWTLTLPASPAAGDTVAVCDSSGTFGTNNLTIGRNSSNIMGAASNVTLDISGGSTVFTYSDSTFGWIPSMFYQGDVTVTPPGYIDGFILANNGTDALNDIDIAAGECSSSVNNCSISLTSSLTKRLDATWVVGTNQGGLDTGAEANSTWYHVWVIRKDSTGAADVLFSTSATAPTMPTGYTAKRRVGSIYNDSSGNIKAFTQFGTQFLWTVIVNDINAGSWGTAASNVTLTTPLGVKVRPIIGLAMTRATLTPVVLVSDPDVTDTAPDLSSRLFSLYLKVANTDASGYSGTHEIFTNTSSQVRVRSDTATTSGYIVTHGWWDPRGVI